MRNRGALPSRAAVGSAARPIEVGSDSDDPRPLVVDEAAAESPVDIQGVSALDTLVDLAVTQPKTTTHQVVLSPPELLVPTAGLVPLTPRCPAMPVPPRPWLLTTVSSSSDGRGIRILTPLRPVLPYMERPSAPRQLRRRHRSMLLR